MTVWLLVLLERWILSIHTAVGAPLGSSTADWDSWGRVGTGRHLLKIIYS